MVQPKETANGDMLQYFMDHPEKLKEKQARDKAKEEKSDINITKPYKPRRLKLDQIHRLARQLYKLKVRQPQYKMKHKKYEKEYLRKNKMALKKRADFVRKVKKRMPQQHPPETKDHRTTEKSAALETYRNYLKRLAFEGIKKIGRGSYSSVYDHPSKPDVVVKVGIEKSKNFMWLKYSKSRPSNPYMPKVHELYRVRFKNSWSSLPANSKGYFIAFTERLKRLDLIEFQEWLNQHGLYHTVLEEFSGAGQETKWRLLPDWRDHQHEIDVDLFEVLSYLSSFRPELDLVQRNLMRRGRQIVFNDPLI